MSVAEYVLSTNHSFSFFLLLQDLPWLRGNLRNIGFSFFLLLQPHLIFAIPLVPTKVLVSFCCYNDFPSIFFFHSCFSFFLLLLLKQTYWKMKLMCFSFFLLLQCLTTSSSCTRWNVLVSFCCYCWNCNYFQILRCFSFFLLLRDKAWGTWETYSAPGFSFFLLLRLTPLSWLGS